MKKTYLFSAIIILFCTQAFSQYTVAYFANGGNPNSLHAEDEFSGSGWITVLDITTVTAFTNVYSSAQTIPFAFNFNGSPVTQFKASNTGYITFTTSASTAASALAVTTLPSASIPNNSVCAWGAYVDNQSSFGKIESKTFGTAGSRQLWIMLRSFYNPNGTDAFDFTYWGIVLEEGTNKIYVVRQWEIDFGGVWENFPVSVGVQINATTAIQAPGNPISIAKVNTSNFPADNDYWAFTPTSSGINELNQNQISIFPNPAKDMLTVNYHQGEVQIFDIHGKLLLNQSMKESNIISTVSLAPGMYFLKITDEEKISCTKFLVQ